MFWLEQAQSFCYKCASWVTLKWVVICLYIAELGQGSLHSSKIPLIQEKFPDIFEKHQQRDVAVKWRVASKEVLSLSTSNICVSQSRKQFRVQSKCEGGPERPAVWLTLRNEAGVEALTTRGLWMQRNQMLSSSPQDPSNWRSCLVRLSGSSSRSAFNASTVQSDCFDSVLPTSISNLLCWRLLRCCVILDFLFHQKHYMCKSIQHLPSPTENRFHFMVLGRNWSQM